MYIRVSIVIMYDKRNTFILNQTYPLNLFSVFAPWILMTHVQFTVPTVPRHGYVRHVGTCAR